MCATYKDKQKRSHFESFANKIHTGIREIKPQYAEKRAIWELFQNALDTVDDNGIIVIAKTEKGLLFKHNGRPFKDDEFGGLIKQFSVGKTYGDNKDKLGQYGTGFISTHVYGKTILVNGSIQIDDGTYRTLADFQLDRDANGIDELTDKLLDQDDLIEKLCDNTEAPDAELLPFTSFEYQANKNNRDHIDQMIKYVETILPYIFCFNDKLKEVRIFYDQSEHEYVKTGVSNGIVHIFKNGKPVDIPFLEDNKEKVKVIIGSKDRNLTDIPKQFLFYPLMETVDAGYNFIVHANDFKPNKERDYLYKKYGNEELKADIETNEKLLKLAFDLVLKKAKDDDTLSFMDIAKIEFTQLDSDFEKRLKSDYINTIRILERLNIGCKKYSLTNLQYFDESILLLEEDIKYSFYSLLTQFRSLPPFEKYCELSKYVNNWNDNLDEKFNILESKDIAKIIANESGGNYFYIIDKTSFQKFISQISVDISLLNKLALVPNIHGDFKHFENLVRWESDEPELVKIVDNINSSISEKYIHEQFKLLDNLNSYNREKFKEDFSKFCNDLVDNILKEKDRLPLSNIRFSMLIENLKNFVALNKKTQLNVDVVDFYERVFQLAPQQSELSDPTVNVNYQPAIKLIANLYVKNLAAGEIKITYRI